MGKLMRILIIDRRRISRVPVRDLTEQLADLVKMTMKCSTARHVSPLASFAKFSCCSFASK
jgi:hypothetical protein